MLASSLGFAHDSSRLLHTRLPMSSSFRKPSGIKPPSPVNITCAYADSIPHTQLTICSITSPFTDPKSFAALGMALETVGGSAYMGAAQLLSDKNTLTVAAVCSPSFNSTTN